MSKTHAEQVKKAQMLAEGLRGHMEQVGRYGVTDEAVEALLAEAKVLEELDIKLDAMREEVSKMSKTTHEKFMEVKTRILALKRTVKQNFVPERWIDFGVLDKR